MLTLLHALPAQNRSRIQNQNRHSDAVRRRALERLYMRKAAVDELIESLENYARMKKDTTAPCVPFTAAEKWS